MGSPTRRAAIGGAGGLFAAGAGAAVSAAAPSVRPRRVASLSPCLDAILVQLAPRARIAALSHWSGEAGGSTIVELARTLPATYGSAEEIAILDPDLVISSVPTPLALRQALPRLGVPLAMFAVPSTVEESLQQVREVAARLGEAAKGEALIGRILAALAAAAPPPGGRRISALVFQSGGFASGPGTLMDEMLTRAGFSNQARRYGMTASGNVSLERLLDDPPEVLLVGESRPGSLSWGERILQHPALRQARGRMRPAVFPAALVQCGGPVLIPAAGRLAQARRQYLGMRA